MLSKEEIHCLSISGHSGLLWFFLILFTGSCGTDSLGGLEPGWSLVGLENTKITVFKPDGDGLLVGTEEGLFRWTANRLRRLGLQDFKIRGVVRVSDNSLVAAVSAMRREDVDHPGFWRLQDESDNWEQFHSNYGGEEGLNYVYRLESTGLLSDTLYTRGCGDCNIPVTPFSVTTICMVAAGSSVFPFQIKSRTFFSRRSLF